MAKVNLALVDDEEETGTLYKSFLRKEINAGDLDIFFFTGGIPLLDFLRQKQEEIKIIILVSDINMPEMDGITLVDIVSEEFPGIDLYLSSAYDYSNYEDKIKKAGVIDYLEKPINFDIIKKIINEKM